MAHSDKKKKYLRKEKLLLTTGTEVEVKSEESGFELSWYAAKIVGKKTAGQILIQYDTLTTEDGTTSLVEEKPIRLLRPKPKEIIMVNRFVKNDIVDAFFNDGWWQGSIDRVLSDDKYYVRFENYSEVLKFSDSQLRVHQVWRNGTWKSVGVN